MRKSQSVKVEGVKLVATTNFDIDQCATALGFQADDLREINSDGRIAHFFGLNWLGNNGWSKVSDGRSGNLLVNGGRKYRLRVLTDDVCFSSSKAKGHGRSFKVSEESQFIDEIWGFLVLDAKGMPAANVWEISTKDALAVTNGTEGRKLPRAKWMEIASTTL